MANTKKYYWLKLKKDFFKDRKMKKLRRIAGGAVYTVIYLKLQLLSLDNDGYVEFEGIEEDLASELELELDETKEDIEATLFLLEKWGLIECKEKDLYLPQVTENTGKEGASAERVRKMRLRNKEKEEKALLCNMPVTICNTEKSKSIEIDKENSKNVYENSSQSPLVQQMLNKYNSLNLKKYEIVPSGKVFTDANNALGTKKLFEALEIMSRSSWVRENMSIESIFKTDNLKKALNGAYRADKEEIKPVKLKVAKEVDEWEEWKNDRV